MVTPFSLSLSEKKKMLPIPVTLGVVSTGEAELSA
jgi:hypothetical protein